MPQVHDYDLACIGSGPAGQRAAVQAAKLGKRVAVLEKQRAVGGVCIETGTIPSKTFREAVLSFGSRGQDGDHDPERGRRNRPSMEQLVQRVAQVVKRETDLVRDQLSRNEVDLIRGHASFLDPHTLSVESSSGRRTLKAEYILVAVGTRPSEPSNVK